MRGQAANVADGTSKKLANVTSHQSHAGREAAGSRYRDEPQAWRTYADADDDKCWVERQVQESTEGTLK